VVVQPSPGETDINEFSQTHVHYTSLMMKVFIKLYVHDNVYVYVYIHAHICSYEYNLMYSDSTVQQ